MEPTSASDANAADGTVTSPNDETNESPSSTGPSSSPSWWYETRRLVELAVPTIIVNLAMFMPQGVTAAYVGRRIGKEAMDGFTLANLTLNLLSLSLLLGICTANDTLSPQAFGAQNYGEVGLLSIRGYIVGCSIIVPFIIVLYFVFEPILLALSQPPIAAGYASLFYNTFMWSFPFYILYVTIWKFLSAQEIMKPLIIVAVICCGPYLFTVLPLFIDWYGFVGSAMALASYTVLQPLLLLLYLAIFRPHHKDTWKGLQWRKAVAIEPMKAYLELALGGIAAQAEWWFWEMFVLVGGMFGVIALSIQTIAAQVIMVVLMIPLGTAIALSVRLGAIISHDSKRAKTVMIWTLVVAFAFFSLLATLMYVFRYDLFAIFTTNPTIIEVSIKTL